MKSRYSLSDPIIAFLPEIAAVSFSTYIVFMCCVSLAVSPTKTKTPIIEIAKCRAGLPRKMLTIEATIIPIRPINKKAPKLVRSFFVV